MRSFYTLNSVAETVSTDLKEFGTHNLPIYLKWAVEVYRELVFDFAREIKTTKLSLNSYRALDFPEDYVDWVKVGIQYGDKIYVLGTSDKIALYHDIDDTGQILLNSATTDEYVPNGVNKEAYIGGYMFNNFSGMSLHGLGGLPYKGYFRVDKAMRQLQFASSFPDVPIYLEYISDGINPCGATYIDPLLYDACRQGTHYRRMEFDDSISESAKDKQGRKAHDAMKKAEYRKMDISAIDILNCTREGYSMLNHA